MHALPYILFQQRPRRKKNNKGVHITASRPSAISSPVEGAAVESLAATLSLDPAKSFCWDLAGLEAETSAGFGWATQWVTHCPSRASGSLNGKFPSVHYIPFSDLGYVEQLFFATTTTLTKPQSSPKSHANFPRQVQLHRYVLSFR